MIKVIVIACHYLFMTRIKITSLLVQIFILIEKIKILEIERILHYIKVNEIQLFFWGII